MTTNTTGALVFRVHMRAFDGLYDFLVTLAARLFRHLAASWRDVNVVFKPAGREIVRVPETITRFSHVFGHQARWRVAVVAYGNRAMARLHPAAKLVLHHVTIHTRFGVVGHVRITARVDKRVRTHTQCDSDRNAQNYTRLYRHKLSFLYAFALFVFFVATLSDDTQRTGTSRCLPD
jgi:hypothetical protein